MSSLPNRDEKYLQELFAGKVLGDLSNEELQEFGELFSTINSSDLKELELAAAALHLALEGPAESHAYVADAASVRVNTALPDSMRKKIANEAASYVRPIANQTTRASSSEELKRSAKRDDIVTPNQRRPFAWREAVAWLATAASLILATQLWFGSNSKQEPAIQLTAAESRLELLNDPQKVLRIDWTNGKTPFEKAVTGDVVWNNESQQGFMRFVGMPPNDPNQEQYQLWIIDPDRDTAPIDGGVFNIATSGEVVVPIQAKLKVLKPAAFAITIEKPGGVVVSTQMRLPLLAQVSN